MLRLGDDVSAGTVRGETSVVTSVIAPPTDVTPVVINGHVLAKDGLALSTGFNAILTCKKVINTTGSLTLQGDGANVVTIDANGTISNSGGLNSTGDVSCANVNFTGALGLNGNYGTSGQVLTSQDSGNSPVWASVTSNKVYCRIKATSQSVSNNSLIGTYDNTNAVTSAAGLVSQTTPFTAPHDGDYFIHAHITAQAANTTAAEQALSVMRIVRLRSGVETNIMQSNHEPGSFRNHSVSTIETLQNGDTLGIRLFNDSGNNITIGSSNSSALLVVHKVN